MDGNTHAMARQVANGLGWFSLALGAAELFAPDQLARLIGTRSHTGILRAYGAREIAAGLGLLSGRATSGWLWARVAGDALDLATLAMAAELRGADRRRIGIATAAVAGVTGLDLLTAAYLTGAERPEELGEREVSEWYEVPEAVVAPEPCEVPG